MENIAEYPSLDNNPKVLKPPSKTRGKVAPSIAPIKEKAPDFTVMLHGTATNQLTNISVRSIPPVINKADRATIEHGSLKIFIDRYSELTSEIRTSTHKLLDVCTMALTHQNNYKGENDTINPLVTIPLEQFMKYCGIPITKPSKDKTRRKVKEDLETLYHISMEWTENIGRNKKDFAKMRICDKVAINRGNIIFSFSLDLAKYLNNAYLTQYPMELLKIDERNPNSYPLGKKLMNHSSMHNNIKKGTANILSVRNLLEACPDIPNYHQVLATDRALERRIKNPLETALNSLSSFISWEYSNSKSVPLTDEQLQSTSFSEFMKLYVKFDVIGAPDQTEKLKVKAEEKKKKINARKKRSPKRSGAESKS